MLFVHSCFLLLRKPLSNRSRLETHRNTEAEYVQYNILLRIYKYAAHTVLARRGGVCHIRWVTDLTRGNVSSTARAGFSIAMDSRASPFNDSWLEPVLLTAGSTATFGARATCMPRCWAVFSPIRIGRSTGRACTSTCRPPMWALKWCERIYRGNISKTSRTRVRW